MLDFVAEMVARSDVNRDDGPADDRLDDLIAEIANSDFLHGWFAKARGGWNIKLSDSARSFVMETIAKAMIAQHAYDREQQAGPPHAFLRVLECDEGEFAVHDNRYLDDARLHFGLRANGFSSRGEARRFIELFGASEAEEAPASED
jgi:hypothetical protein